MIRQVALYFSRVSNVISSLQLTFKFQFARYKTAIYQKVQFRTLFNKKQAKLNTLIKVHPLCTSVALSSAI